MPSLFNIEYSNQTIYTVIAIGLAFIMLSAFNSSRPSTVLVIPDTSVAESTIRGGKRYYRK